MRRGFLPAATLLLAFALTPATAPRLPAAGPGTAPRPPGAIEEDEGPAVPEAIVSRYRELSASILERAMPRFMPIFHRDFIQEAPGGAAMDRGPWRRYWLERFDTRTFEHVLVEPCGLLEGDEQQVIVEAQSVLVFRTRGATRSTVEVARVEDTWILDDGISGDGEAWGLVSRVQTEPTAVGHLEADGAAPPARIAALAAADAEAIAAFWKKVRGHSPLVEPVAGDETRRRVTFLWRDAGDERVVELVGGVAGAVAPTPLRRLGRTGIRYLTTDLPADVRFTYEYRVTRGVRVSPAGASPVMDVGMVTIEPDPLRAERLDGKTVLALPAAPPPRSTEPSDSVPAGEVERRPIESDVLGERRFVSVYTPPGLDAAKRPARWALLLARADYQSRRETAAVLDRLIASGDLPPAIVVLVHREGSQSADFEVSDRFVRFVTREIVPWVRETLPVSRKARDAIVGGTDVGATIAAWCALEGSGAFGGVLGCSGEYGIEKAGGDGAGLFRRYAQASAASGLRFHLEAGSLDPHAVLSSSRHLRDVLEARSRPVTWRVYGGNLHSRSWYDALARGLGTLWAD